MYKSFDNIKVWITTQASTCPDSDRYPFLKEIIELDKRYHQNWKAYDSYTATSDAAATQAEAKLDVSQQTLDETARLEQKFRLRLNEGKNILRQINLAKGRYKKNSSKKLKDSIFSLYQQLTAPSDALTAELKQLGIL